MGKKNKTKMVTWVAVVAVVAIVALSATVFKLSEGPTGAVTGTGTTDQPNVQCNKDFSKTITLNSKDNAEKGSVVSTDGVVSYKVWKVVDESDIAQSDVAEGGELEIGYDETYKVVAQSNASDVVSQYEEFVVDTECNGPTDKVFYMDAVPSSIDSRWDSSKIDGANAVDNTIPVPQDATRTATGTFTGESKTTMDAVIVFDVDKTIINDMSSDDVADADAPEMHSTSGSNIKSHAFELGTFSGSSDIEANFDFTADEDATLGAYNVSYTVYQYQSGYIHTKDGVWINEPSIEDNDEDSALLPTYTGTVYLEVTA